MSTSAVITQQKSSLPASVVRVMLTTGGNTFSEMQRTEGICTSSRVPYTFTTFAGGIYFSEMQKTEGDALNQFQPSFATLAGPACCRNNSSPCPPNACARCRNLYLLEYTLDVDALLRSFHLQISILFAWCNVLDRAREKYNRKQGVSQDHHLTLPAEGDHLTRQSSQPAVPADHVTACRSLWIILGCEMRQQGFIVNGEYKNKTLGLLSVGMHHAKRIEIWR